MPSVEQRYYYECFIPVFPPFRDQLIVFLDQLGFSGFLEEAEGLRAYVEETSFEASAFYQLLDQQFGLSSAEVSVVRQPYENWNREWEAHFQPQVIGEQVRITAPFHEVQGCYPYEITIEPQMAFGTGHHATTRMMVRLMLDLDLMPDAVFDYGTGTGLLAILAEQMGATRIYGNETQETAFQNAALNLSHNTCQRITLSQSGLDQFPPGDRAFGLILANINRNTIIDSLPVLQKQLRPDGLLAVSGFFSREAEHLRAQFYQQGLTRVRHLEEGHWAAGLFQRHTS